MRQFDVCPTRRASLVVILQSDFRDEDGASRIVVPLVRESDFERKTRGIDIPVVIDGTAYRARMNQLGAVRVSLIDPVPIANVADQRDAFISAIDLIFLGF